LTFSTSCGSISHFTDNNPVVRNNVYFKFATGTEFSGSAVRIPISCRFQAGFPGFPIPNPENDDVDDLERISGDDSDSDYDDSYSAPNENDFEVRDLKNYLFHSLYLSFFGVGWGFNCNQCLYFSNS
jgi:hypothetical protein